MSIKDKNHYAPVRIPCNENKQEDVKFFDKFHELRGMVKKATYAKFLMKEGIKSIEEDLHETRA